MIVQPQTSLRFVSRSSARGLVLGDGARMEAGHWAETGGAPDPGNRGEEILVDTNPPRPAHRTQPVLVPSIALQSECCIAFILFLSVFHFFTACFVCTKWNIVFSLWVEKLKQG